MIGGVNCGSRSPRGAASNIAFFLVSRAPLLLSQRPPGWDGAATPGPGPLAPARTINIARSVSLRTLPPLRSLRLTPFRSATFARSAASKKAVDHVLWCCRGWSGLLWASGASWWLHVLVGCLGLPLRACALVTPVTTWAVWLLVFLVGWWVVASGRGVHPYKGSLPLLFFPVVAQRWLRPWLRFSIGGYVGFSCPCLTWLLVAPGRPLTFPQRLRFLPFVIFYFTP